MPKSVRVVISGRVQGVGYRAWTVRTASAVGVKGWVRNRSDGTVEAVFSGEAVEIQSMIEACQKGPMLARVDTIEQFSTDEIIDETFFAKPTV